MEDLDESQKQVNITTKKQPIMSQLCKTISKSYINSKQYIDAYKAFKVRYFLFKRSSFQFIYEFISVHWFN